MERACVCLELRLEFPSIVEVFFIEVCVDVCFYWRNSSLFDFVAEFGTVSPRSVTGLLKLTRRRELLIDSNGMKSMRNS